jgi:hypothetical protein
MLLFDYCEIGEILLSKYRIQMIFVSNPKSINQGVDYRLGR